jgi:hypothetical protein
MPERTDHAKVADIQNPPPFGLDGLADDRGFEILAYQVRISSLEEVGARFQDPSSGFDEVLASTGDHVKPASRRRWKLLPNGEDSGVPTCATWMECWL